MNNIDRTSNERVEHELKVASEFFDAVESGQKPFEIRKGDRPFKVGDTLWLREVDIVLAHTGREARKRITFVLRGWGMESGYVALGLASSPVETQPARAKDEPGPWWTPTAEVNRLMRWCKDANTITLEISTKVLEGLLYDSLLWRKDRAAQPIKPVETSADEGFQARVHDWMAQCFVRPDAMLPAQRSFRFTEEALELAQASGTSREDVMRLVDYVYGRPVGAVDQEIGGVVVTLAGLANSVGLSVEYVGNAELARCVENTAKIRAKDLAKPQRSPLPGSPVEPSEQPPVETGLRTGELAQLRTIDAAARFYVDSVKPGTGLAWENLMNALFDGRPEKAK